MTANLVNITPISRFMVFGCICNTIQMQIIMGYSWEYEWDMNGV